MQGFRGRGWTSVSGVSPREKVFSIGREAASNLFVYLDEYERECR